MSVQAVSVYGPGNWTEFKWVTIPKNTSIILYIVLPIIVIIIGACFLALWCCLKTRRPDEEKFVTVNGAYISVVSFSHLLFVDSCLKITCTA